MPNTFNDDEDLVVLSNLTIKNEWKDELDRLASERTTTRAGIIREAIKEYLDKNKYA